MYTNKIRLAQILGQFHFFEEANKWPNGSVYILYCVIKKNEGDCAKLIMASDKDVWLSCDFDDISIDKHNTNWYPYGMVQGYNITTASEFNSKNKSR